MYAFLYRLLYSFYYYDCQKDSNLYLSQFQDLRNFIGELKLLKKLDKFTKDGIYNKVIKTSESKYAVIYVYNSDKSKIKPFSACN